jgi:carbon storage regulator
MLVLSRKPLQSIMIGPNIRITVVKVERNQVRIGIEAPRELTILRSELLATTAESDDEEDLQPATQVQFVLR